MSERKIAMDEPQVWQFPIGRNCIARITWSGQPYQEDIDVLLDHLNVQLKHNVYPTEEQLRQRRLEEEGLPNKQRVRNFIHNLQGEKCSCGKNYRCHCSVKANYH